MEITIWHIAALMLLIVAGVFLMPSINRGDSVSIMGPPQEQRFDWIQNCLEILTQNGTAAVALKRNLILNWTGAEAAPYNYERLTPLEPGARKYERCWVEALEKGETK